MALTDQPRAQLTAALNGLADQVQSLASLGTLAGQLHPGGPLARVTILRLQAVELRAARLRDALASLDGVDTAEAALVGDGYPNPVPEPTISVDDAAGAEVELQNIQAVLAGADVAIGATPAAARARRS